MTRLNDIRLAIVVGTGRCRGLRRHRRMAEKLEDSGGPYLQYAAP
jgi:hypothetical protein